MIQLQVLSHILNTNDTNFITENNLTPEFFSDYPAEFAYIQKHINDYGKVPDLETFLAKYPSFDLIKVSETNQYLVDALYEDRNKRFLIKSFNEMRDLLNAGKTDEAMNKFATSSSLAVTAKHIECVDIIQQTEERYNTYLDRSENFDKSFVKTGFKELDDLIGGWDRSDELATIAARTNMGKSWVLLKCATAALEQGLRVGIYSGEMSELKVGYRIDTLLSHIPNKGLIRGDRQYQNQYKIFLDEAKEKYKEGCIKVLTPSMMGGPAGVTALRSFIERENLDMLCVDQHSLLMDDRKARNPVEKAANISNDLKNLQVMKKIPIIAVSQQNRTSTENGISTEHIAQSDRIAQDSTTILFFEQKDNVMIMHLVKARDSEHDRHIKYALDLNKGEWTYIPEENNAVEGKGSKELYNEFEGDEF